MTTEVERRSRWRTPAILLLFSMAFLPLFASLSVYSTNHGYPTWPLVTGGLGTVALAGVYSAVASVGALYTVKVIIAEVDSLGGSQDVSQ